MEIISAKDALRISKNASFTAYEFPTSDPSLNLARIELRGRYPLEGTVRNNKVKEIVYVEAGRGDVTINGVTTAIEKGDVILYEPGEEVFWEGTFSLVIACTPKWTAEQHEQLR